MFSISKVLKLSPVIALVSMSLLVSGCAKPKVQMSDESRVVLGNGSDMVAAYHGPIQPNVLTPVGALAGAEIGTLMGAFLSDKDREMKGSIATDAVTKMDGPMKVLRNHLVEMLASQGMGKLTATEGPSHLSEWTKESESGISGKFGKRYILAIEPSGWNVMYFAANWNRYWMQFYAEGAIVDSESGSEIWRSRCNGNVDNKETAPTWDELNANNRQLLQKWINQGTKICAQQFADELMGKSSS